MNQSVHWIKLVEGRKTLILLLEIPHEQNALVVNVCKCPQQTQLLRRPGSARKGEAQPLALEQWRSVHES